MDSSIIWKVIEINQGVEHSKKRVSVPRFDPNRHPKRRWSRTWVNSSPHSSPNSQVCTQWSVEVWLYPPINLTHPLLSLSFPVLYILFLFSTSIAFIQFCGVVFVQPWYNLLWLTGLKNPNLLAVFFAGIVYCFSQKESAEVARGLQKRGIQSLCYHANLAAKERSRVHRLWASDQIQVSRKFWMLSRFTLIAIFCIDTADCDC